MIRRALACCCALLAFLVVAPATASTTTPSISISVSTSTALLREPVSVSGTIASTGRGVAVELQVLTKGTWQTAVRSSTTYRGRFAIDYTASRVGRYTLRVVAPARGTIPAATTRSRVLTVLTPSSVLLSTPDPVTVGQASIFTGRVAPTLAGAPVQLERWTGSAWEPAASGTVGPEGSFQLDHAAEVGTTTYRVVAPRHRLRAAAASPSVDAVVTPVEEPGDEPVDEPDEPGDDPDERTTSIHLVRGELRSTTGWQSGDVVRLSGQVTVPADATVTVPGGVVMSFDGSALVVAGTLRLGSGVVLTASADPATSGGASAPSEPSTGATTWPGVTVTGAGHADLADASIRHADVALTVVQTASATWSGSVTSVGWGLLAYGYVDARGVDWGDPSGPAPFGSGARVGGYDAHVVPWAGYSTADRTHGADEAPTGPVERCDDVVVLGARGSGEAPGDADAYEPAENLGLGQTSHGIAVAVSQRIAEERPDASVAMRPVRYPAYNVFAPSASTQLWPLFLDSLDRGSAAVAAELRLLRSACPDTLVVVTGSSQGAMVVKLGLQRLTATERDHVAAVVLTGDASREPGAPELVWSAAETAASQEDTAVGGLVRLTEALPGVESSIPADLLATTTSLCRSDDVFCSARRGGTVYGHLGYSWDGYLQPAGRRAGTQVLAALSVRGGTVENAP